VPAGDTQLGDPGGEPEHDARPIRHGRLRAHLQDVAIVVVQVPGGQAVELLAGVAEELEEGEQQGEVGPTEPARPLALEARGVLHVRDDVGDRDVVAVGEGGPAAGVAQLAAIAVKEAQLPREGLHEREQVGVVALVDRHAGRRELGELSAALAGAVAAVEVEGGGASGHDQTPRNWVFEVTK
jgi:hypothetical protein